MAKFAQTGYGQVEPNRLSGITFGNLEGQAPAVQADKTTPVEELENGMFMCIVADENNVGPMGRVAVFPADANAVDTPYLVFSERKQYDQRDGYADFVDRAVDKVDGTLYPRLVGITPDSCVFTTNTVNESAGSLVVGDMLYIGDDGYLTKTLATNTVYTFEVIMVTTMPDAQPAVKVMARQYR